MKYIKSKTTVVLFSEDLVHREVAQALRIKPESAGFVEIDETGDGAYAVRVYGESITLDLQHDPKDAELIGYHIKAKSFT